MLHDGGVGLALLVARLAEEPQVDVLDGVGHVHVAVLLQVVLGNVLVLIEVGGVDEVPVGLEGEALGFDNISKGSALNEGVFVFVAEGLDVTVLLEDVEEAVGTLEVFYQFIETSSLFEISSSVFFLIHLAS